MLGEIAMYSMIICLLSGTFLTFWFVPSAGQIPYNGSYLPLNGVTMSEAYRSTLDISFDVRGGLLIRKIHHWAALLFIVAVTVHMFRVFFTGAFRKPREIPTRSAKTVLERRRRRRASLMRSPSPRTFCASEGKSGW